MLKPQNKRRSQLAVAIAVTALIVTLWLVYDLPIAILPVLIYVPWIPFLPKRDTTHRIRLLLGVLVGLTVLAVLGTAVFVFQN